MALASQKTMDDLSAAQRDLNEAIMHWYAARKYPGATTHTRAGAAESLEKAWETIEGCWRRLGVEIEPPKGGR